MVALIGGVAALILGVIGLIAWWDEFIWLLKGVIPVILLLGGALAAYLGLEEIKDKRRAEMEAATEPFSPEGDDVERYKQEVAELKAKLAALEAQEADEGKKEEEEKKEEGGQEGKQE
jgi:hypothetical protein